jgi:hypothetical protein
MFPPPANRLGKDVRADLPPVATKAAGTKTEINRDFCRVKKKKPPDRSGGSGF